MLAWDPEEPAPSLIAGESHVSFPNAGSVMPHVKSGRLKALAVCSTQPSALAPGLPTVTATGLPGYESVSPQALSRVAPARARRGRSGGTSRLRRSSRRRRTRRR